MITRRSSLEEMILKVQRTLDSLYGYGVCADPSSFGYQATQSSLVWGLHARKKGEDLEGVAAAIHEGWATAARSVEDPVYASRPEKRAARLKLAAIPYASLSSDEKEKDRVIALAIMNL
jgi:hypothetical protein